MREETLGWAEGMNRWRDGTGMYHRIVLREGSNQSRLACGRNLSTGGLVPLPTLGHACSTCLAGCGADDPAQEMGDEECDG